MSEEKKPRFHIGMRLHIRDNLFGDAMVMNTEANGDSSVALIEEMQKNAESHINTFRKIDVSIPVKRIEEHIESLMRDGWSRKRIISHFAQFDIVVDDFSVLPPEKKQKKQQVTCVSPINQCRLDVL